MGAYVVYLCLIGIYVLLPMYKIIAEKASDEQIQYILLILFVFESVFVITKILVLILDFIVILIQSIHFGF